MHQHKFAERENKGRKATAAGLMDRLNELFGSTDDGSTQWANVSQLPNGQVPIEKTDLYLYALKKGLAGAAHEKLPGRTVERMTDIREEVLAKIENSGAKNRSAAKDAWREEFNSFARELMDSGLIRTQDKELSFRLPS